MTVPFSLARFAAILAKEFIQMRRDRVTFAMMLGVPLMQLVLFGFAINTDPRHLPAALVTASHDAWSRTVVSSLEASGYYRFTHLAASAAEAEQLIARGAVSFVVTVPSDLAVRIERRDRPQVLVEADATDPLAATAALAVLPGIAERLAGRRDSGGALAFVTHRRYNPEGLSRYNIVPALLGVILQMTMTVMTAMALTRELERGTMENLLAMPARPVEIMLGKVMPFLVVGAVQVTVVLAAAKLLFDVPFAGSLWVLAGAIGVFVLALVLLGYAFSTFARTQMQAMQLTFSFFLPSILLSGFMFPYAGMPGWAQAIGELLPLTHFLRIVRAVMLKGAGWDAVAGEVAILGLFVLAYAGLAQLRFRRTLD